jgi:hypothetical protein
MSWSLGRVLINLTLGAGLTVARVWRHAWAERDALQLKADALDAQGDRDGGHAERREAEAMTRRLIPPDLDLS